MGELRLYAIGLDEVRGIIGAPPHQLEQLRELARRAFAAPAEPQRSGLLGQ